eukprot:2868664-Pyramimonas_sp.AAC.1
MTAASRHRSKLGDNHGVCAGAVLWMSTKRVARVVSGGDVLARDAVEGEADHAPRLRSSVGGSTSVPSSDIAQAWPTCADGARESADVAGEERHDTGGGSTVEHIQAKSPNESTVLELVRP